MSETQKFLVFSNPTSGQEIEYNRWYDDQHLPDVLRVPGICGAKRYEFAPIDPSAEPTHRYLAIYELEPQADPAAVMGSLMSTVGSDAMPMSDALDMGSIQMAIWKPRS